jgi:membrane associated rhomboid family serine protease
MIADRRALAIKFRYIFVPLMALTAAMVVGYSLLNWLLVARSGLIPLDEEVVDYRLPLAVSWILVFGLIQPALGLLKSDRRRNLTVLCHFAAVAMVACPTLIAQGYVRRATGEMTHAKLARDIGAEPRTKYYFLDDLCIDTGKAVVERIVSVTGYRRPRWRNFDEYAAVPLCARGAAESEPRRVWIGLKFHKSLSDSLERFVKETEYANFIRRTESALANEDPKSFRFLERVGRNADRKGFAAALRHAGVDIESPSSIVLIPHNEPFEQRTGHRLAWTWGSLTIGAIVWLGLLLLCPLDEIKAQRWLDPSRTAKDANTLGGLHLLVPNRRTYGLPVLFDANILVFAAMVLAGLGFFSFDTKDLLTWGANYGPALHGLGVIRLVTSEFVHAGIMHLLNNLYGLLFAGIFLLPVTGNTGLILCYLLAGLGGSIVSAVVHPAAVSVGASGAIFGLFGILLTLLLLRDHRIAKIRQLVLMNVVIFVSVNLFIGAVSQGIDNAAHLGGLATGALLGLAVFFAKSEGARGASKIAE